MSHPWFKLVRTHKSKKGLGMTSKSHKVLTTTNKKLEMEEVRGVVAKTTYVP